MIKIFLLSFFSLLSFVVFAQIKNDAYLTNVEGGAIKLSQLSDTTIKVVMSPGIKGNCTIRVYFHEGGFYLQTVAVTGSISQSWHIFNTIGKEMRNKLTVGTKITIGDCDCNFMGKTKKYNLFGTTYKIVAD